MNIDELRAAQSKERQKSDLQQLRESFYGDVAAYVDELEAERERAAERADDPFGSPAVQQLTNDIETAKDTAEAIYERRLGKIVKKASLVSAEMANPNDVNGLTEEEQALFADLVDRIERNKTHMLDVIAGDVAPGAREDASTTASGDAVAADASPTPSSGDGRASADAASTGGDAPHPENGLGPTDDATAGDDAVAAGDASDVGDDGDLRRSEAAAVAGTDDPERADDSSTGQAGDAGTDPEGAGHVSAADLMGGDDDDAADTATGRDAADATDAEDAVGAAEATGAGDSNGAGETAGESSERATLRVTEDVGEIFGVDEREYTLSSEDVVTLPEENADILVAQGAAERLD